MELKEYLDYYGIKQSVFCKRTGIAARTIWNVIYGFDIKLSIAVKIEKTTEGRVTVQEIWKTLERNQKRQKETISEKCEETHKKEEKNNG